MNSDNLIQNNLDKFNIPHKFSNAALKTANSYPEPTLQDFAKREDLRHVPLCTIDGEDSRDFDDAVFCEPWKRGGFHLIVSIADVARYVHEGTTLDDEAFERGTSVYFPQKCIPMLPKKLSNGLCSLNPNVNRLALSVHIYLDKKGQVKLNHCKLKATVINSHARLTYKQVQHFIDGNPSTDIPPAVQTSLLELEKLRIIRLKAKAARYSLDYGNEECHFQFKNGIPSDLKPYERFNSHKLIEETAVLANNVVRQILQMHGELSVNRYHPAPTGHKLHNLQQLINMYGLGKLPDRELTPKDLWDYVHAVPEGKGRSHFQSQLLRAFEKAIYTPDSSGHFGLALDDYCHFTSPIRRYPDLIVHRLLYRCLRLPGWQKYGTKMTKSKLQIDCNHLSRCEVRAKDASNRLDKQLTALYYQQKDGNRSQVYDAVVIAIDKKSTKGGALHARGVLVNFDNGNGRALLPISSFSNGSYSLGKDGNSIVRHGANQKIKPGSKLTIALTGFNLLSGHINAKPLLGKKGKVVHPKITGRTLNGQISRVTEGGIYLNVKEAQQMVYVPLRNLTDDYFIYKTSPYRLEGRNHGCVYKCGMQVKVFIQRYERNHNQYIGKISE